jgi:hypothetical protein
MKQNKIILLRYTCAGKNCVHMLNILVRPQMTIADATIWVYIQDDYGLLNCYVV